MTVIMVWGTLGLLVTFGFYGAVTCWNAVALRCAKSKRGL
jgi:hypothetical protein